MKEHKRELPLFSFYDVTGMARHLERMARKGWMLEHISGWCWRYRRTEPKALHFTVSYALPVSEFEPSATPEQEIFRDFCGHAGWKIAASSGAMQIFYNEGEDPVPIETEPELEINSIHNIARRQAPVQIVLMLLSLWMGASWCASLVNSPIDLLSSAIHLFSGACWLAVFLWCAADLAVYFIWRHRALRLARQGEFLPTRGCRPLLWVLIAVLLIHLVYTFWAWRMPGARLTLACMLGAFVALVLVVNGVKNFLKRRGTSAGVNRAVTLTVDIVLAFVLMGAVTWGLLYAARTGALSMEAKLEPPLTVAMLGADKGAAYRTETELEASALLSRSEYQQRTDWEHTTTGAPWMKYTVVDVHAPFLYDWCVEEMYRGYDDWIASTETGEDVHLYTYREADPAPWGAERAWQIYDYDGRAQGKYLLCWEGRIVALDADWVLTDGQMATAGRALAPSAV